MKRGCKLACLALVGATFAQGQVVTQADLENWLSVWQKRQGLEQWKIDLRIVRQSELESGEDGDVEWWGTPGTATIRVLCAADMESIDGLSPASVRRETELVIVHELMHLVDASGNIAVTLDGSGRTVAWNLNQNKHVDYAYAMTSHSSQGATVDRALIHIDTGDIRVRKLIDETLAYVATSRPRYDAQIFTDDADQLSAALSRRHENATALSPEQITVYSISV